MISAQCVAKVTKEEADGTYYTVDLQIKDTRFEPGHFVAVRVEKAVFDKYEVNKTYALLPTGQAL